MKLRISLTRDRRSGEYSAGPVVEVSGNDEPPEDDVGAGESSMYYIHPDRARELLRRLREYFLARGEVI